MLLISILATGLIHLDVINTAGMNNVSLVWSWAYLVYTGPHTHTHFKGVLSVVSTTWGSLGFAQTVVFPVEDLPNVHVELFSGSLSL